MKQSSIDGWKSLSSLLEVLGVLFLGVALYYLGYYFMESTNPYRNEYIMGMVMGLMIAMPFWLLNFYIVSKIKTHISKFRYWFTMIIALSITLFILVYIGVGFVLG